MQKGEILNKGKTKVIWSVNDNPDLVIVENKDDITKNDDPSQTKVMAGKAELATATTCAVFQLLKDAGIPVAYEKQLSLTDFLAPKVEMILLEIIWRRYAVGSFLKRHPERRVSKYELPYRFHRSVFELFLKTTKGNIVAREGTVGKLPEDILKKGYLKYEPNGFPQDVLDKINEILNERDVDYVDDPFILNPFNEIWDLRHPKIPSWDNASLLEWHISRDDVLPEGITVEQIENLLRRVGLVLECAWSQLGCRLIDFKIEIGVTSDGKLMVADVIDADSWRLRSADWQELSKQLFRDNVDMDQIADKYALVAKLVKQLRIPRQAIVVWRGSKDDPVPEVPSVSGIEMVDVVVSGHKSPQRSLRKLEDILTRFPEGGVILACVGMSNGLGPVLAARTSWPVIGVSITADKFTQDVWSSLRTPSKVPMSTILSPKNAVLAALNILAQKNPVAYAERQMAIEDLDE